MIEKSPFSKEVGKDKKKPQTTKTTEPYNPMVRGKSTGFFESLKVDIDTAKGSDKEKSSMTEERRALDTAYRTNLAKIGTSTLSEGEKVRAKKALTEIYNNGLKQTEVRRSIWTTVKEAVASPLVKAPFAPFAGMKAAVETSAEIGKYLQSATKELNDLTGDQLPQSAINEYSKKNPDKMYVKPVASFKEFKQQAKDKDFKLVTTGNKYADAVIDFGADVVFDPSTYVGVGPIAYLGKMGKFSLVAKLGTDDMLKKYPELIGKLDDIATFGLAAVPKTVRTGENLEFGIRFAGKIIPHTDVAAEAISGRGGITDILRKGAVELSDKVAAKSGRKGYFTPASRVALRIADVGRGKGVSDKIVRNQIAHYTASKYGKGFKATTYNASFAKIKDLLKEVRDAGATEKVALLADDAAALALEPNAQLRQWATSYRQWQDDLLNEVNSVRAKFNKDYGADMKMINKLDDYGIHHKMTDKAFRFAYGPKGRSYGFRDADLSAKELSGSTGAAMFRKYKYGEEFMGEVLEESKGGIIKQVNEIFKRQTGADFNFFETDLYSVADSYAYSMAAKRGQEAYVRRLLDFGGDVAQVINKKLIPDDELVKGLKESYDGLKAVKTEIIKRVNKGRLLAKGKAEDAVAFAKRTLDVKDARADELNSQIGDLIPKLFQIEAKLHNVAAQAAAKGELERGTFNSTWGALIDEVRQLRTQIESGRISEVAAYEALKDIFVKMRPDAKRIPKSATRLLDTIQANNGVGDWTEVRELEKRLSAIQTQLADAPPVDPDDLNDLLDLEQDLVKQLDGFRELGEVKLNADYAEDGLLFGSMDDLVERPFDPNLDATYRVISSRPISAGGGDMTTDEIAALRNAQLSDPNTVAVHAIPESDIIDMRTPEAFYDFWNPDGGVGEAANYALSRAGLDGDGVFKNIWDDIMDGNPMDPQFQEVYPELADLMVMIGSVHANEFPLGIVEDELNIEIFATLQDLFERVAASTSFENSDVVAKQMTDDFMRAMVEEGVGNTGRPVLFPSGVVYGADNPMADGAFSLVLPDSYNYASGFGKETITDDMIGDTMSPVHFTSDDAFIKTILDADYHTASLEASETFSAVGEVGQSLQEQAAQRAVLASEAKTVGGKLGGVKSAGSRRVKAAEKAYADFEASGMVEIISGGNKVRMPRDKAVAQLAKSEQKVTAEIAKLEAKIARATERELAPLIKQKTKIEERYATLMRSRKVIENWNQQTGDALRADIELITTAIMTDAPLGWNGTSSRQWADRITSSMNNIDRLGDSGVRTAWERVITQLGADEAQLALLETVELPAARDALDAAVRGYFGGQLRDDIEKGWVALESTGVKIPEEFNAIIKPNIDKLRKAAEQNNWIYAYKKYNQIFKTYVTMTPGFLIRNAMSATFMNKVGGVDNKWINAGTAAAVAYRKHGPNGWLKALNLKDDAEREIYETMLRSVRATSRGVTSDLDGPVLRGGWADKVANKIADNFATRGMSRANEFVEDMVRFPMALDTLMRGGSYDDAVYRVTRFHFDYSDLSQFDETMKNFIPFWVWTTRNLPLQMTEMLLRPKYYAAYDKLEERNPVAADVMLPAWARSAGAMGISGNVVAMPDMPQNRLFQTAQGFITPSKLVGQANPLVKLPIEMLANKQLALDIPFNDKYEEAKGIDKAIAAIASKVGLEGIGREEGGKTTISPKFQYALGNILPPIAQVQRYTGGAAGGKSTYKERQLSSILTALGIPVREFGEQQQRGEAINRQFQVAELMKEIARRSSNK